MKYWPASLESPQPQTGRLPLQNVVEDNLRLPVCGWMRRFLVFDVSKSKIYKFMICHTSNSGPNTHPSNPLPCLFVTPVNGVKLHFMVTYPEWTSWASVAARVYNSSTILCQAHVGGLQIRAQLWPISSVVDLCLKKRFRMVQALGSVCSTEKQNKNKSTLTWLYQVLKGK